MNYGKKLMKVMIFLAAVCVMAFISSSTAISAEDKGELKVKEVHSYDEFLEFIESDDYLIKIDDEQEGIDDLYTFVVDKPGWLLDGQYTSYSANNFDTPITSYVYKNKLLTTAASGRYGIKWEGMHTELYRMRKMNAFFLDKGTYYVKLSSGGNGNGHHHLMYLAFLPCENMISVDKIDYNDDFTSASVSFKLAGTVERFGIQTVPIEKAGLFFNGTSYSTAYSNEKEKVESFVTDAIEFTENGTYYISVDYADPKRDRYDDLYYYTPVTIDKIGSEANKVEVKSAKMSKTKATLKVGNALELKVTLKPKNVTDKTVTWKSSNAKVATVDENGKVTAKKKGTCTITVTASNGKKAKCKITVKK